MRADFFGEAGSGSRSFLQRASKPARSEGSERRSCQRRRDRRWRSREREREPKLQPIDREKPKTTRVPFDLLGRLTKLSTTQKEPNERQKPTVVFGSDREPERNAAPKPVTRSVLRLPEEVDGEQPEGGDWHVEAGEVGVEELSGYEEER